ncbi:MAG: hypothetical protein LBE79_13295, partial [Tannerella sp.]|nr:hypothetical protein [Tannerella sp.]
MTKQSALKTPFSELERKHGVMEEAVYLRVHELQQGHVSDTLYPRLLTHQQPENWQRNMEKTSGMLHRGKNGSSGAARTGR